MKIFSEEYSDILAIAFDLDDTLYDRAQFEHAAYRNIAKKLLEEKNINDQKLLASMISVNQKKKSNYPKLFETSLADIGVHDKQLISMCLRSYRSYKPKKLELFPSVYSMLIKLRKDYHLGLITNGREETQKKKVKALGIERLFDEVIYTDSLAKDRKYRKPHPKSFEILLDRFGIEPKEFCYIGDNPEADFEGPITLGMRCIRVLTGEYRYTPLKNEFEKDVYTVENLESIFL